MSDSTPVLARFSRPTATTPTRIALLADLHLSVGDEGTWRVAHRTEERLRLAVDSLNAQDLDAVLFVGDLVQNGTREEFDLLDEVLADLDAPFLAVPGNHDLHDFGTGPKLDLAGFERLYTPSGLPFHERIGSVDLIGLNSNPSPYDSLAETYTGLIDAESLDWLDETLSAVENPLVAVHHNLAGTRELLYEAAEDWLPVDVGSPPFENADDLAAVLHDHDVPLTITGHVHFPAVVPTRGVREFTLPAMGAYPCGYTTLDITTRGTVARFHSLANGDRRMEALASGHENARVLIAAAQLAGLPLLDECVR